MTKASTWPKCQSTRVKLTHGRASCISPGDGAAVLIRAVDPVTGVDEMRKLRQKKKTETADKTSKVKEMKEKDLGSGPSKLTQALAVNKATFNQKDITTSDSLWLEPGFDVAPEEIVASARVGVDYAEEWAKKPLRFYVLGNKSVSVRDKEAEKSVGQGEKVCEENSQVYLQKAHRFSFMLFGQIVFPVDSCVFPKRSDMWRTLLSELKFFSVLPAREQLGSSDTNAGAKASGKAKPGKK